MPGLRARWWWCIQAERGRREREGERLVSPINDRRSEAGGNGCSFVGNINLGRSSTSVSERAEKPAWQIDRLTDGGPDIQQAAVREAGVNRVSAWPRVTERGQRSRRKLRAE